MAGKVGLQWVIVASGVEPVLMEGDNRVAVVEEVYHIHWEPPWSPVTGGREEVVAVVAEIVMVVACHQSQDEVLDGKKNNNQSFSTCTHEPSRSSAEE